MTRVVGASGPRGVGRREPTDGDRSRHGIGLAPRVSLSQARIVAEFDELAGFWLIALAEAAERPGRTGTYGPLGAPPDGRT
jgi:hypothetical protein